MVFFNSRVALIAASISLAAISNTPTVDAVAVPVTRPSEVVARHAPREDAPVLPLPGAAQKRVKAKSEGKKKKVDKSKKKHKKGEHHHHNDRRNIIIDHGDDGTALIRVGLHNHDGHGLLAGLKRSGEQVFFHVRRGPSPAPHHGHSHSHEHVHEHIHEHGHKHGHHHRRNAHDHVHDHVHGDNHDHNEDHDVDRRDPEPHHRHHHHHHHHHDHDRRDDSPKTLMGRAPRRFRAHPRSFARREMQNGTTGRVELQGDDGKNYGYLTLDPNNEIGASKTGTSWQLVDTSCPAYSEFSSCVKVARVSPDTKSICITYNSGSGASQGPGRSSMLGAPCVTPGEAADDKDDLHPTQTFGFDDTNTLHVIPYSTDSASPSNRRRDTTSGAVHTVSMVFHSDEEVRQSSFESTDETVESSSSSIPSSETSTVVATTTSTMTVTVTATSDPTSVTASPTSHPLKVEVFDDATSSEAAASGATVDTSSSSTSSSVAASATPTTTTSIDGDVVASSIAADYGSSYDSVSATSTDLSSTSTVSTSATPAARR